MFWETSMVADIYLGWKLAQCNRLALNREQQFRTDEMFCFAGLFDGGEGWSLYVSWDPTLWRWRIGFDITSKTTTNIIRICLILWFNHPVALLQTNSSLALFPTRKTRYTTWSFVNNLKAVQDYLLEIFSCKKTEYVLKAKALVLI